MVTFPFEPLLTAVPFLPYAFIGLAVLFVLAVATRNGGRFFGFFMLSLWSLVFVALYGYTGLWWFALPAVSLGLTAAIVGIRLVLRILIPREY